MRASPPLPTQTDRGSVILTARHMADAVSYLTRVADNAGLRGIAGKLTHVRASLLKVAADGAEEDDADEAVASGARKAGEDEDDGGCSSY